MDEFEFEAILSEVGVIDLDFDIILPGAFDEAISAKLEPNCLMMHRRGDIVGQWSNLRMDGTKLMADGLLYTGDDGFELARMCEKLIRTEQLSGVSIGFRVLEWTNVADDGRPWGWDISKLELKEASLVDMPANPSAEVTELKRKLEKGADPAPGERLPVIHKYFAGEIRIKERAPQEPQEPTRDKELAIVAEQAADKATAQIIEKFSDRIDEEVAAQISKRRAEDDIAGLTDLTRRMSSR